MADNIDVMTQKALKGIAIAREYVADDPKLLRFLDRLEAQWNKSAGDIVLLCIALWAMGFKNKDDCIAYLRQAEASIDFAESARALAQEQTWN